MIEVDIIEETTLDSPACCFREASTGKIWMLRKWPEGRMWHLYLTPVCPHCGADLIESRTTFGPLIARRTWICPQSPTHGVYSYRPLMPT